MAEVQTQLTIIRKTVLWILAGGGYFCKFNFKERLVNILIAHSSNVHNSNLQERLL